MVYYILFLPGIALYELSLWLAAGILKVRAERAIAFPEEQAIGELRLTFVKLSPTAGAVKRSLITLAPILTGALALWAIATQIFDWRAILDYAAAGTVDGFAQALASLTSTADFWLWLYLAFVIANTMFPSPPTSWSRWRKGVLLCLLTLLALVIWSLGGTINSAISLAIESLWANITILTLQITALNIAVILALGLLESLVEHVSGRSATFRDGKMITATGAEAPASRQQPSAPASAQPPAASAERMPKSIYAFKLPIPGPPGREPVSRHAVSVVHVARAKPEPSIPPPQPKPEPALKRAAPEKPAALPSPAAPRPSGYELGAGHGAPFSRPFSQSAGSPEPIPESEDMAAGAEPFARPFAPPAGESSERHQQSDGGVKPPPKPRRSRTRPVPKPSQREAKASPEQATEDSAELRYEPLEDEPYLDEEGDDEDETFADAP